MEYEIHYQTIGILSGQPHEDKVYVCKSSKEMQDKMKVLRESEKKGFLRFVSLNKVKPQNNRNQ